MSLLILFNKPFDVLSQFTDDSSRTTLSRFVPVKNVYPAGRLDRDSEGLLLLTDDGRLQHRISNPENRIAKCYWVQVEGNITDAAIRQLCKGVELKDGMTLPAKVKKIPEPGLWPRNPPIRERLNVPTSWLEISILEGRNRQVRRMTAAAGFPTLRLVRFRIGHWSLDTLAPGKYQKLRVNPEKL